MIRLAESKIFGSVPVEDLLEQLERFMESPASKLVIECLQHEQTSVLTSLMDERPTDTADIYRRAGYAAGFRDAARMFGNVHAELENRAKAAAEKSRRLQMAQRQRGS